jgi:hypothetical protein
MDFFYTCILFIMDAGESKRPNCLKCAYFKITWDPAFPRSCELFGFKGQTLPSAEVCGATGQPCPAFVLKEGLK